MCPLSSSWARKSAQHPPCGWVGQVLDTALESCDVVAKVPEDIPVTLLAQQAANALAAPLVGRVVVQPRQAVVVVDRQPDPPVPASPSAQIADAALGLVDRLILSLGDTEFLLDVPGPPGGR